MGYVLWRSIWLVDFLLFWGCLGVFGKRLVVRLPKWVEFFWKRLPKIRDGSVNVWGWMIANGASGAIDSKL